MLRDDSEPLLEVADMVKLDALSFSDEQLVDQAHELASRGIRLVAERIENHEAFERCKEAGFELFQGYSSASRRPSPARACPPAGSRRWNWSPRCRIRTWSSRSSTRVISRDLGVSYRLLRFINSAYFSLPAAWTRCTTRSCCSARATCAAGRCC